MRGRASAAVTAGGAAAFAGLGFTAVFREGFETVLFYQALTLFAEGLPLWVAAGAAAAALGLAGIGYAIFGLGRKLPIRPMLITGVGLLLLLSVAFVGNAVRSLQSIDMIQATPIEGDWARLPIFLAELTGFIPPSRGSRFRPRFWPSTCSAPRGSSACARCASAARRSSRRSRVSPGRPLRLGVDVGGPSPRPLPSSPTP